MEEDLYPTTNGFSNASSISNSLNPAFPKSSLFGSYNNSFAVGSRWTIFLIKSFEVGGGPCYNQI